MYFAFAITLNSLFGGVPGHSDVRWESGCKVGSGLFFINYVCSGRYGGGPDLIIVQNQTSTHIILADSSLRGIAFNALHGASM